jgi:hypothetical protein
MIISQEQFRAVYGKLPQVLREYLADDDLTTITEQIGKEHQLHVDTIGALYRETTNMLLGIINPTQFVGELKSVGVPEESIGAIVQELNEKVFMPLREKIKNQTQEPEEEGTEEEEPNEIPEPAPPVPPTITQAFVAPNPSFVEPNLPIPTPISEAVPTPVSAPAPVPVPVPTFIAPSEPRPLPKIETPEPTPVIPEPHARTMQEDMLEMKSAHKNSVPLAAPAAPSVPTPPTPSAVSSSPAQAVTPPPTKLSENRDALHAVLKNYGIDPYREPPE